MCSRKPSCTDRAMQHLAMKTIFQSLQRAEAPPPNGSHWTRLARQPIFDRSGAISAYELLFRPKDRPYHGFGDIENPHVASAIVMLDGFNLVRPMLAKGQRLFINFTEELLEAEMPLLLPPEICVLEIAETATPTPGLLASLAHLRRLGYTCALDNYAGQPELQPFLAQVDIVKINSLGMSTRKLFAVASGLCDKVALLASKIEDPINETFCRGFGFSLFQGNFFAKAEIVEGSNIRPAEMTRARLLSYVTQQGVSLDQMTEAISADLHLTYKLLNFVRSVHFGQPGAPKTVPEAIALLGGERLKKWLFAITLADFDTLPMQGKVAFHSALRARFLALLGEKPLGLPPAAVQQRFMLGLFSLLATEMPRFFEDLEESIAIDHDIMLAYREQQGPLAPWLALASARDSGDAVTVETLAATLNLSADDIDDAHQRASAWSATFFGLPPAP